MARRVYWFAVVLLLGCSAPEDENRSPRCATHADCDPGLMCYRTYCIPADRFAPDAWSEPLGDATVPTADAAATVGGDAAVPSSAAPAADAAPSTPPASDAPNSGQQDAGSVAPASPSTPPANTSTPPASTSTPPPNPSNPPADAGIPGEMVAPSEDPSKVGKQPAPKPPASDMPAAGAAQSAAEAMIVELIETGRAPVTLIFCVGTCAVGFDHKECQKCLQRVLGGDYDKEACDDDDDDDGDDGDREKAPGVCTLLACKGRSCESDS